MKPRLGFLGTGWIGRHRMAALAATGLAEIVAVAEPDDANAAEALALVPGARRVDGLGALLREDLDAVVIATPSAAHAEQSIAALEAGKAVFCQKPLGRTGPEVAEVVEAARRADRLLGVDLSYRQTAAMGAIRPLLKGRALGHVFGVDVTFHNAWGPDKPWFHDPRLSGGGCVVDLGVHLGKPAFERYGGGIWDYDKAWALLRDHVQIEEKQLRFELHRYLSWPGQAPSYRVGQRIWEEMRREAQRRAVLSGEEFTLKDFHTRALNMGSLPLDVLREQMMK